MEAELGDERGARDGGGGLGAGGGDWSPAGDADVLAQLAGAEHVSRDPLAAGEGAPDDTQHAHALDGRTIPRVRSSSLLSLSLSILTTLYRSFSLGNGLGPFSSHLDLSAGLHGLEGVGTPYDLPRSRANTTSSSSSTSLSSSQFDGPFFVGPEGERVGEACACWLAKWGREILSIEEWLEKGGEEEGLPLSLEAFPDLAPPPLRVWSSEPGGLPARWVRGVISSDAFFLGVVGEAGEGEFARYLFARKVVELRRREKGRRKVEERVEERREKVAGESRKVASLRGMHGSTGTSVYELAGEAGESDFEVAMEKEESDEDEGGKETMKVLEEELVEEPEEEVEEDDKDEKEYAELFRTGIHYSQLVSRSFRWLSSRRVEPSLCRPSSSSASSLKTSLQPPASPSLRRPSSSTRSGRQKTLNPASPSAQLRTRTKPRTPPTPPAPRKPISTLCAMARRSRTRNRRNSG